MNLPPFKMYYEEMVSHELLKLQYDCSLDGHASFCSSIFSKTGDRLRNHTFPMEA
jgi:hypothetical protein